MPRKDSWKTAHIECDSMRYELRSTRYEPRSTRFELRNQLEQMRHLPLIESQLCI